jgi:hypothetical protein
MLPAVWILCSLLTVHADTERNRAATRPVFETEQVLPADEGHATLNWSMSDGSDAADGLVYQLQQSREPAFGNHSLRHEGPESAIFVSGLRDGTTYFRVRAVQQGTPPGPWSETLEVEVDYPTRGHVLLLLSIGSVVFVATVIAIVAGWVRYTRGNGRAIG